MSRRDPATIDNAVSDLLDQAPRGVESQPVSGVVWVDRNELHANDYNPNHVAPPELQLLKVSLLADGWTQPIVARSDGEVVDGFHRWTVAADPEVGQLTGGRIPVVYLPDDTPREHQMMSTIRHNRARGTHTVVKMADIVVALAEAGTSREEIGRLLQMEDEEVGRFMDYGSMMKFIETKRPDGEFGKGWVPDR